jgi:hypothetical protein
MARIGLGLSIVEAQPASAGVSRRRRRRRRRKEPKRWHK